MAGLLWDACLLDMGLRVWREKIMLMLHVRRLDENTLAHRMYRKKRDNSWPGLAEETQSTCEQLEVESVHTTGLDVQAYRKIVTKACHRLNELRLREKAGVTKKENRNRNIH